MIKIILLILLLSIMTEYTYSKKGEVIVNVIKGFMIGALYNVDYLTMENRESGELKNINEYTIQLCLLFITFTFIWRKEV